MRRLAAAGLALISVLLSWESLAETVEAGSLWSLPTSRVAKKASQTERLHRLDVEALDRVLAQAPMERTAEAREKQVVLSLPMPDGSYQRFRVEVSPVMEPLLAAKFPEIQTFRAVGMDDPAASARMIRTPERFEAQILSRTEAVLVEPVSEAGLYRSTVRQGAVFSCGTRGEVRPLASSGSNHKTPSPSATGDTLRTYRLAVASTADFTALTGGTKQTAMTFIAGYVNRVNGIYERDLTVRFRLVNNNEQLIFLTKPDGYTDDNADAMLDQNQAKVDAVIGTANYDLGMVFGKSQPGRGNGVAQLRSVCSPTSKAMNAQRIPAIDPYWDSVAFHETAHQFGANHTFNSTVGPCASQKTPETSWEPGGGTTLMAYATVCDNIQGQTDLYFHGGSIAEIAGFLTEATCAGNTATGVAPPTVSIPNGPFNIPKGTPFSLTAAGSSAGGTLTYCWEEMDTGTPSAGLPDLDDGSRPIFRSFPPSSSATRVFPQLADILSGTATKGESLPTTARTMKFRVTARDNRSGGGGVNAADTTVTVNPAAGPFTVTAPASGASLPPGSTQTVTWAVAGTNAAPLSVANVKISLSSDGGQTFPTVLAESVPNTGSATVKLPEGNILDGRVKVEAVGGIFFAISPAFAARPQCQAITITPAALPEGGVLLEYGPVTLTASGGTPPYTFAVTSGTAPWAVELSAAGILAGPPQEAGTTTFTVTATDSLKCQGTAAYTLKVVPQANIGDAGETVGTGGRRALALIPMKFPVTLSAPSASPVTLHYETVAGTAQEGQDYVPTSGTLTFAPGETEKTIEVMVNNTPDGVISESFEVVLSQPEEASIGDGVGEGEILEAEPGSCPAMVVTPPSLPGAKRGLPYSQTISATGGAAVRDVILIDGTLPAGLTLNGKTGVISGTPRTIGVSSFAVEVLDANSCYEGKTYSISVEAPAPAIASVSPARGSAGTVVSIDGSGLLGVSAVSFGGGRAATVTSATDISIQVRVPSGARTGPISLTTPGGSATSTESFTVLNVKPVAVNGAVATGVNKSVSGRLIASDADGGTLSYSIFPTEKPGQGTAVVTNASTGEFTYTPATGFSGTDTFFFQAYDGTDASNVGTVTITVSDSPAGVSLFVPVVLSAGGQAGAFFGSELTLTNRGTTEARLQLDYTAAGGGGGTAYDSLPAGRQKIVPDALAYLRSLNPDIAPADGNRIGTLRVTFTGLSSPEAGAVTVRTANSNLPGGIPGRAGLAYSAAGSGQLLTGPAFLFGLRQNDTDRSNVGLQNAGTSGDITLRLTVISGSGRTAIPDITLGPGGFRAVNEILRSNGLSLETGFVRIDKVAGSSPYYAYAVINDQSNSDGSFVPPVKEAAGVPKTGATVPVVVKADPYLTELILVNSGQTAKTMTLTLESPALYNGRTSTAITLEAGQQRIIPDFVAYLRGIAAPGVPATGAVVGALFMSTVDGDASGLFLGARTSSPGAGGRFGVFYPEVPTGTGTKGAAWLYGLQQNSENRTNLALVNTGDADASASTYAIEIFDGETGQRVTTQNVSDLAARQFTQINAILGKWAPSTRNGYARVSRTSGQNPFITYAVVNDGGQPGERTGDGAYVASVPESGTD